MYISEKNLKLQRNENSYFLIWNIPAEKTCPGATELCKKYCYAKKAERMYENTRNAREQNLLDSLKWEFVDTISNEIQRLTEQKKNIGKQCYFRIHESGDFYSREYFLKWVSIAMVFPDIRFMAYTKSVQFFNDIYNSLPDNLVIRYSIWEDSPEYDIDIVNDLDMPIFTASRKYDLYKYIQKGYTQCGCNCQYCKMCYNKRISNIVILIH